MDNLRDVLNLVRGIGTEMTGDRDEAAAVMA
jgi:L-2,4-diaminobutyrate decarboxylase